jgi:surface protein
MSTIITDDNINELVGYYLTDKNKLPNDLKNVPIGSWDVSNVTDMGFLFSVDDQAYKNFDEDLSGWDVSNVTYMGHMFSGCRLFNKPLNNWDVSNVTVMRGMFFYCENFNQPLNNWDISNVTSMDEMFMNCINFNQNLSSWNISNVMEFREMFVNCGISQENKPLFVNNTVDVDAEQIHRESSKINFEKLNDFLSNILNLTIPQNIYFPDFVYNSIASFIEQSNLTEEEKNERFDDLERIMDERLGYINYGVFSESIRDSIFYVLEYVEQQPNEFKEIYASTFIQDCVHAYEGDEGMTCAAGAVERIIFSLLPACTANENNENYKTIIDIITANPSTLIPEYIKDWYKLHKTGSADAFPPGTSQEEKKNDLRNYLLAKFPEEENLINDKIVEISDNIGYEDDDFMYGGKRKGKRRTKKNIKGIKSNKISKKIRKVKKTRKNKNIVKNKTKNKKQKTKNKKQKTKNKK